MTEPAKYTQPVALSDEQIDEILVSHAVHRFAPRTVSRDFARAILAAAHAEPAQQPQGATGERAGQAALPNTDKADSARAVPSQINTAALVAALHEIENKAHAYGGPLAGWISDTVRIALAACDSASGEKKPDNLNPVSQAPPVGAVLPQGWQPQFDAISLLAVRAAGYFDPYAQAAVLWYHDGNERAAWLYLMCSIMKELHA